MLTSFRFWSQLFADVEPDAEEVPVRPPKNVRANAHPSLHGYFLEGGPSLSRSSCADRLGYAVVALRIGSAPVDC